MSFRFLSAKSYKPKKTKKKKNKVLPRTAPPWFCFFCFFLFFLFFFVFFVFFGFFGSLFFFGFCFFLCFLSCRRFLCVGVMFARGLSSCISQRFACIDMHFMCILRTLVVPCSEKKRLGFQIFLTVAISSFNLFRQRFQEC